MGSERDRHRERERERNDPTVSGKRNRHGATAASVHEDVRMGDAGKERERCERHGTEEVLP